MLFIKIAYDSFSIYSFVKIDSSGNLAESTLTETQLESLPSDVASAQADATQAISDAAAAQATADGNTAALANKADLVAGKIPSSQIPAVAITDVFEVADIAARDALTIGSGDGEVQEGDVVIVTDASADPAITSGAASYIYDGAAYKLLKSGDEVLSVNGQTGAVTLDSTSLNHTQGTPSDWTVADGSTIGAHLDEVGSRLTAVESVPAIEQGSDSLVLVTNNVPVSTNLTFTTGTDLAAEVLIYADSPQGTEVIKLMIVDENPGTGQYVTTVEGTGLETLLSYSITSAGVVQIASSDVVLSGTASIKYKVNRIDF